MLPLLSFWNEILHRRRVGYVAMRNIFISLHIIQHSCGSPCTYSVSLPAVCECTAGRISCFGTLSCSLSSYYKWPLLSFPLHPQNNNEKWETIFFCHRNVSNGWKNLYIYIHTHILSFKNRQTDFHLCTAVGLHTCLNCFRISLLSSP